MGIRSAWRLAAGVALLATSLLGAPATATTAPPDVTIERIAGSDRIATAIAVSQATHDRASTVVLARADDFADAFAGAPVAAAHDGPLLLTAGDRLSAGVRAELDRLGVGDVVLMGGARALSAAVEADLARTYAVRRLAGADRYQTAATALAELPAATGAVVTAGGSFTEALSAAPLAAQLGWPLLLTTGDHLAGATRDALRELRPEQVLIVGNPTVIAETVIEELRPLTRSMRRLHGPDVHTTSIAVAREARSRGAGADELWLATSRRFPDGLAAGPAVAASGASLLLVDGGDLREGDAVTGYLRELATADDPVARIVLLGGATAITDDADWQLPVVLAGNTLPRGGYTLFPRHRMVAFYGNHSVGAMGVLGEQPPDQAYDRLWQQAAPYEAGGRAVLPTFELIVSVATKGAGDDGDYSNPSTPAQVQPWLDAARRHGAYLLLDLQTGRTDFLTDAKRYEQFLIQPDVGLALDPEWRMDADEVPAQSVGEVHADEVNAVAGYLAGLVRTHALPEKLLVIHQFQNRMVEDKHLIGNPPELEVMFHMDGHGSRFQKLDTYRQVSDATGRWSNGFKLFYDEDRSMFSPRELLDTVRPVPDLISYQ